MTLPPNTFPSMGPMPGSERSLPPTSGYYTYGATAPQSMKLTSGSRDPTFLEGQDETFALNKPAKVTRFSKGFLGFNSTDILAMNMNFFVPLLIFAAVYLLSSYYVHYKYAVLDWTCIAIIFVMVGCLGYNAAQRMLQNADGATDHVAVWAAALFIGVLLAFFVALIFGERNYQKYMQPYYQLKELNHYSGVDASGQEGKAFMDAGSLKFKEGSHLDFSKSAGFMNLDMYCVAPIITPGNKTSKAPASYDFWAVGINCCTGASDNFACGPAVHSKTAASGLRLMSDSQLPFYKMAVTQAMTKYGITSAHPIFFHLVQDEKQALSHYESTGWDDFFMALFLYACFQAVIVVAAAMGVVIVKSKYA